MTVFDNVAFGLQVRPKKTRPSKAEIRDKAMALLHLVQLDWTANRYPSQLSGGQRQRIALARALAVEPKVLLLDEPFGALDFKVRRELRRWLRRLHDDLHITSIFVTHDQSEALEVSDRVVIMDSGRVEQIGTPEDVYDNPVNPFVYHFLGDVNMLSGQLSKGRALLGDVHYDVPEYEHIDDSQVFAYVRPQDIEVSHKQNGSASIGATIVRIISVGPLVRLEMKRQDNGEIIEAELVRDWFLQANLAAGSHVFVSPRKFRIFPDIDRSRQPIPHTDIKMNGKKYEAMNGL